MRGRSGEEGRESESAVGRTLSGGRRSSGVGLAVSVVRSAGGEFDDVVGGGGEAIVPVLSVTPSCVFEVSFDTKQRIRLLSSIREVPSKGKTSRPGSKEK